MNMDVDRWQQVRQMFERVCELPASRWREELERLSGDPVLVAETLALLTAQTAQLGSVSAQVEALLQQAAGPELGVGDAVGPWRLVRHLASGGMGSVFVAERADALYEQQVAIKLLRGLPDPYTARQLASERQILASLQHPNIARLYDGGTTPMGQPYLVMEYVQGTTLDAWLREHAPGLDARLDLFDKICGAVQAAHAKLVLHCDLKPGNVMVRADGEPVLLDFGIAHLLDAREGQARNRFCTLPYASPELLSGAPVGVASDVFGLGIMLLELVAGAAPTRGLDNASETLPLASVLARGRVPRARRLRGDLDAVIARACAIDPEARYGSAAELARELQRLRRHYPVQARGGGRLYRARRLLRRRWRETLVGGVALAMTVGFVSSLRVARDEAREQAMTAERVSAFLVSAFQAADPRERQGLAGRPLSARDVLDASARSIDQDLDATPAMRAHLRAVIGRAYLNLGLSRQAEPLLRQAARESQALGRLEDASAAQHDLALLLANERRGKEALVAAQASLALSEQLQDAGMISGSLNMMGLALKALDRYPEAEQALQRALALRRQHMREHPENQGPGSDDGSILHNLALVREQRGDYAQAEQYFRQAMAVRRKRYGERSYEYRAHLDGLAGVLREQGRLREATRMQERSLALAREQLGNAPNELTQSNVQELAGLYQDLGDLARSRDFYQQAREELDALGQQGTLDDALLLNNYATLQEARGEIAEAEALYRRSLEIRRQVLGAETKMSLNTEANLGRFLMRNGRLQEAEPLLAHSYRGMSKLLEPDNPALLIQRLTRAELWLRRGDVRQARTALEAATPAKGWASASAGLRDRRDMLAAEITLREGDAAGAAALWGAMVARTHASLDESALPLAKLRLYWAEALVAQGRKEVAREQLALARPVLEGQLVAGAEPLRRLQAATATLQ